MDEYPAVLFGGPPHSGKSVLLYSLSQALRDRGVAHYALRASPDGEGDWSNEAPGSLVRELRTKGDWSDKWVERMCRDIANRRLPLLVDIGGKPTEEQKRIFAQCTHAVLIAADSTGRQKWLDLFARSGLALLADLKSELYGVDVVEAMQPRVAGVISGLERGSTASGPVFAALTDAIAQLFITAAEDAHRQHLSTSPVELTVDLDRLAVTFGVAQPGEDPHWEPHHLQNLLDYFPTATELAVYGRAPIWLHVALALQALPAAYFTFDPRLGWIAGRQLAVGQPSKKQAIQIKMGGSADFLLLTFTLADSYLDYAELEEVVVPRAPNAKAIILSGQLPNWLYTSLASTYARAPWLAIYQPQLQGAVIVSALRDERIGEVIRVEV